MQTFKGKNGVTIGDNGDSWRAHGSPNVSNPQMYDYVGRDEKPTGVRYAMGFDPVAGGTRIAYVDYPKSLYTAEEISNSDDTPNILMRCNVCHAMDTAAKHLSSQASTQPLSQAPSPVPSISSSAPLPPSSVQSPSRISVGDVFSSPEIPKYINFGISLGKAFALRPVGDAAVTLGLSFLADLLSGIFPDPAYKRALQSFSDGMIDGLDPDIIDKVKQDALSIAEAAHKDGDAVLSLNTLKRGMFKTHADLRREVNTKQSAKNGASPQQPAVINPYQQDFLVGRLNTPRLFE